MISGRARVVSTANLVADLAATGTAFGLAHAARHIAGNVTGDWLGPVHPFSRYVPLLAFILPLWALVFYLAGLYGPRFGRSLRVEGTRIVQSVAVAGLLLGFVLFAFRLVYISRPVILAFLVLDAILLTMGRSLVRAVAFDVAARRRILVAGSQAEVLQTVARLDAHRDWGLAVVGLITDGRWTDGKADGHPVLGTYEQIPALVSRLVIDEVLFVPAAGRIEEVQLLEPLVRLLEERGIVTRLVVNFLPRSFSRISIDQLDGVPLLTIGSAPQSEALLFLRRIVDVVMASALIVLVLPFGLAIAAVIKLTSPGPVLFRQTRCGLNGRPFTFLKFRSMQTDAEALRPALEPLNEMDGPVFKVTDDPRATPFGRWLRRSSLDELPQLWNILTGDMSFVGPRPSLPEEVEQYEPWQRRRLSMKPGLTCLWQIQGRNEVSFSEWMRLDLEYIDNWSPWLDVKIVLKTIPAVLLGRGAR